MNDMKKSKEHRMQIIKRYDSKNKKYVYQKRIYALRLCRTEIGVLKAALEFYRMCDDFGCELWNTGSGDIGNDRYHQNIALDLRNFLNASSKVKPQFGWGDIDYVHKILLKEFTKSKKEAKRSERLYGRAPLHVEGLSEDQLAKLKRQYDAYKKQHKSQSKHSHGKHYGGSQV